MQRRPLQTTQRKADRSKSQQFRQTNSGYKKLKVTSKGKNAKKISIPKLKKDPLIKQSQSPKNNYISQKQQTNTLRPHKRANLQFFEEKEKRRKKIVSYKSHQIDHSLEQEQQPSVVQIQLPPMDDAIDDDINMLLISNYPKSNNNFLKDTHLTFGSSKKQYFQVNNHKKDPFQKPTANIRKTNSKNQKNSLSKSGRSKTASEKTYFFGSNSKAILQKSHKKLEKSLNGIKASIRSIEKPNTITLSKTQYCKKQKSQSTETNKRNSPKKYQKSEKKIKLSTSQLLKHIPRSIPKPSKSKKKKSPQKINQRLKTTQYNHEQELSSDRIKSTPTLQELQRLRQQNQKKNFLATSAFKVQDLKKQIEQQKQIRESQRGIYNFQMSNLKKQIETSKNYLGHLYSYEESSSIPGFIPDQIIVETDNESSQVRDSVKMISKISKKIIGDESKPEDINKIRKTNGSVEITERSNPQLIDFLSDVQKISSLEVRLSLEQSQKSSGKENKKNDLNSTSEPNFLKLSKTTSNLRNDESENALLLLNSISK